jgi:hypothetical protein
MTPAVKELRQLYWMNLFRRYPSTPTEYFPPPKYSDRTANGLTKMVIDFIRLSGGQAERISVTGRSIDRRKVVSDCMGARRMIGSLQWIRPTMTPGTADISATVNGRSVKIEVKIGKDKQSSRQIEYQKRIEDAGGVYIIARNFDQFYQWYISTFKK